MSLEEMKQQASQFADLWQALMPDSEVPGPEQFLLWVGYHDPSVISLGLNRAAAKRLRLRDTDSPMNVDGVTRYASGVMRHVRSDLIEQQTASAPKAA